MLRAADEMAQFAPRTQVFPFGEHFDGFISALQVHLSAAKRGENPVLSHESSV